MSDEILFEETITPGATWSHILKRGTALRLTDSNGEANVGAMFFNFECPTERLNIPDSLKAQHISRFTTGTVLYSDMGRVLVSVTDDTLGWHDPLGGHSTPESVLVKYGKATYQECRNDFYQNARDCFLIELAKWGLNAADLSPNVNFFSKVAVDSNGNMACVPNWSKAGKSVVLRAEMNVLTILNTCQHPMDISQVYSPKPIQVQVFKVPAPGENDLCRKSCPENERGFILTQRYFM